MSWTTIIFGLLGLIVSAVGGRLAFYMWGKKTRQAEAVATERDDLERQLQAEQEVPHDPEKLADHIRRTGM